MDHQTKKYLIEVKYTLWQSGIMPIDNRTQMMNLMKEQISDIFNPLISIQLKDKEKIEIWQDYLNSKYEKISNEITIKTVRNVDLNEIQINLIGKNDKCQIMQLQIQEELNQIQLQVIKLQYKSNNINTFDRYLPNISTKFRKQLDVIQQQQADLKISIATFDAPKQEIGFKVSFKKNTLTEDQVKQLLLEKFIQKLELCIFKVDFKKFLNFLEIDNDTFEETYDTICQVKDDQVIFLSTQQCLAPIKRLIEIINLQDPENLELKIHSNFVFKKLQQMINTDQLKLKENVVFNFIGLTTIKLVGPKESVQDCKKLIISAEQQLNDKLTKKKLEDLNQKEVNFFNKQIRPLKLDDYLKNFECEIDIKVETKSLSECIVQTLDFEGRQLNIAHADISKVECDAIVNSCNNLMSLGDVDMLSGVATKIFSMAGADYTKFCESYIKDNNTLECGKAITYKLPSENSNCSDKYIINVCTPVYASGQQTEQDILIIGNNIKAIFDEANKNKITTLALPIFGGGACGFSFMQIVQNVLNFIINNLYSQENKSVKTVYVIEMTEQKLNKICQILQEIFKPQLKIRQIKYQWQFELGGKLQNYDDEEINKQIDEVYEKFEVSKTNQELKLVFPISKQPGTHIVDLKKMIIKDKDLNTEIKLSFQTLNNSNQFLFDNQQISAVLNEYLMIQKLNNNFQFEIFYKSHNVIFNTDGEIHQINEKTGYIRKVNKIPYEKQQVIEKPQNILIGKNLEPKQNTNPNQQIQYYILVTSFDIKVFDDLQKTIKDDIIKQTMDFTIELPNIKQQVFDDLKNYLVKKQIKQYGEIRNGEKLILQIFKGKQEKIQAYLDNVKANTTKYPSNWIPQDKNFIKVDLSSDSDEYKKIETEFKKSDNGKISKIFRLQNQRLWENYQFSLKALQEYQRSNGYTLTDIEQKRYLWHGVRGQHPKIIYDSMKEAFDITYSAGVYWGLGIYFAQNAKYSREYSYQLKQQDDDPIHANKKVFLYCRVSTGKIYSYGEKRDKDLRRPPESGYDCVSGFTMDNGGSDIFVLYEMDVRRAYPEYEVIYE